jgi:MoxR-like ATPase
MAGGSEGPADPSREALRAYRGDGARGPFKSTDPAAGAKLREALTDPAGYRPSEKTRDAVNVALLMGMPLLVSGEPGSGKTQLGYAVAHELGLDRPKLFVTKSTSQARDLFYRYDAIRHFHAAQTGNPAVEPFLHLEALGRAIFEALPVEQRRLENVPLQPVRKRSVVIVDEIDKAPRDFPNDLLHEVDHLRFRIPELGDYETPPVEDAFRPILFVTTNSEQLLPEAFLRRCAFLHLEPPRAKELAVIIERRFTGILTAHHALVEDVAQLFDRLRDRGQLERPPSSAELLEFLTAILSDGGDPGAPLHDQPINIEAYLPLLVKSATDFPLISAEVAR